MVGRATGALLTLTEQRAAGSAAVQLLRAKLGAIDGGGGRSSNSQEATYSYMPLPMTDQSAKLGEVQLLITVPVVGVHFGSILTYAGIECLLLRLPREVVCLGEHEAQSASIVTKRSFKKSAHI